MIIITNYKLLENYLFNKFTILFLIISLLGKWGKIYIKDLTLTY